MNRAKLLKKVKNEGKVKGVCLDVFEILCESPGITGGEVFMKYKKKNPRTKRSRNELAKRITDLCHMGAVHANGMTYCPLTGKNVTRWFLTGDKPVRPKAERPTATPVESNVFDMNGNSGFANTSGYVAPANDCVDAQVEGEAAEAAEANLATLRSLASRCRVVLAFRWFLLPGYKKQTRSVLDALEWAIEKGQQ